MPICTLYISYLNNQYNVVIISYYYEPLTISGQQLSKLIADASFLF